ncbi:receptor-like serine/threonine-protein kinase SD1-8 [Cinnamomum micranthum f. kanehirae]|uniref:Receptor-like serine/threonine-protein kinase n=1 Tax=Cinnamomum micranthum f. kanehirae TaxID=337451 RepID=A0A3S3NIB5_9MAGN|nr:receptor-like serine/threonine-protein kinase SD1-8 [Cinnamomum micranthum f. kanehirae]
MKITNPWPFLILYLAFFPFSSKISIAAQDTITSSTSLSANDNLTSAGSTFVLGFFTRGNSTYLGIWYKRISVQTVVWVANRDAPLSKSTGILRIDGGNLILVEGLDKVVWSTNISKTGAAQPIAQLLDTGNLVLREDGNNNSGRRLWQSFEHPSDTLLPGMRLGWNSKVGLNRSLTSWKNDDDPSSGDYNYKMDQNGLAQCLVRFQSHLKYRTGPWTGVRFSGVPEMQPNPIYGFYCGSTPDEVFYTYELLNSSLISRLVLNRTGHIERYTWDLESNDGIWKLYWRAPTDQCDEYSKCGPYGICNVNSSSVCGCVKGFEPKTPKEWSLGVTSAGCVRKAKLECTGDGFLKLTEMKLPDSLQAFVDSSKSLEECEIECLNSCSCVAYASADIAKGSGCIRWAGDLTDLKQFSYGGQDLYIRVPASELGHFKGKKTLLATILSVNSVVLLFFLCGYYYWWKKKKGYKMNERHGDIFNDNETEDSGKSSELQLFSFNVIVAITKNFSESNMIGKGGFGLVYKGQLPNGQEIALKRLSKNSGQGIDEFKNEVKLIAKLQHKNLVRLLGCCISREEKILIYEYMCNKSLDSLLFDQTRSIILDWRKRFNIIVGIARGILYLHEDSRLRIIHRDLKASNILLDDDMNPKISDFGMARIFGGNQTQANTNKVVGTYGYMSPEYAMDGLFSIKSDIFSFGVWELWKEDRILELIDSSMSISTSNSEVLRCIQVGLLCVQENAIDRPNMSSVIYMLGDERMMPLPKQPAFCFWRGYCSDYSRNEITIRE